MKGILVFHVGPKLWWISEALDQAKDFIHTYAITKDKIPSNEEKIKHTKKSGIVGECSIK